MISKVIVVASVLVVLASVSAAQRPFYAGSRPWYDHMGPQTETPSTSTSSNTPNNNNSGGLGDRNQFLTPAEDNISFRFYNNVPIEGPGMPCIGCVYRLTRNGFVMVRP